MKYNLEWLIIGYFIQTLFLILFAIEKDFDVNWDMVILLPFLFWGMASYMSRFVK